MDFCAAVYICFCAAKDFSCIPTPRMCKSRIQVVQPLSWRANRVPGSCSPLSWRANRVPGLYSLLPGVQIKSPDRTVYFPGVQIENPGCTSAMLRSLSRHCLFQEETIFLKEKAPQTSELHGFERDSAENTRRIKGRSWEVIRPRLGPRPDPSRGLI